MGMSRSLGPLALVLVATVGSEVGFGQQKVEMMPGFGIPVAPRGLWGKKLPTTPMIYDTAEGQRIRVVIVTKELSFPWTVAFLPDGNMLVTERAGRLRIIRHGVLDPKPVAGVPAARNLGVSGDPGAVHVHREAGGGRRDGRSRWRDRREPAGPGGR